MRKFALTALGALVIEAAMPIANAEVVVVKHGHHQIDRRIAHHEHVVVRQIVHPIRHDHAHRKVVIVR